MGIRGLTTYISSTQCYESYELHDGYLVIDGHSLAFQIYTSSKCNCIFGGDYDVYAHAVGKFFDDLAMCKVVPLVVLDGGMEQKKMKTAYERMLEKLHSASRYTPGTGTKFAPLSIMIVFETVVRQKGVRLARSVFEADPAIAGIAQILNCPVLSFDSDFYIFKGMYIPLNTLEPLVSSLNKGKEYMKRCKIFKTENLLKLFRGLDSSVLPLASILLGNDYVKTKLFKNFFADLRLSKANQRLHNEGQRRIDATLQWLKSYNLNNAVAAILRKLPKKNRRSVLGTIEVIINSYLVLPFDILVPLGFSDKYAAELKKRRSPFKFQGDIDTLESEQLWRTEQVFTSENSSSEDQMEEQMDFEPDDEQDVCTEEFAKTWPSWFARCFGMAEFPTYFVDMMCLRLFMITTQIESLQYPSAYTMSLKIVEVIYGLLVAGSKEPPSLLYQMREGLKFTNYQVGAPVQGTISTKFPPLAELRETSMKIRKQIINDTLQVTGMEQFFEDIPEKWKLYLATICYWMRQADEPPKTSCHVNALLFAMLLGVVDDKIGYQRSLYYFNKAHSGTLTKIESDRKNSETANSEIQGNSIIEALKVVTKEDCFVAAPFILRNYTMDDLLIKYPRKFNVIIVHAFAQFQSCLRHAIDLNVLLGCPYENPIIAEMYNGTLIYNLYTNFEKRANIEAYISVTLENSPSLLNLIRLLIARMKMLLEKITIVDGKPRGKKRRKNKGKKDNEVKDDDLTIQDEGNGPEVHNAFVDPNNPFSVLGF